MRFKEGPEPEGNPEYLTSSFLFCYVMSVTVSTSNKADQLGTNIEAK